MTSSSLRPSSVDSYRVPTCLGTSSVHIPRLPHTSTSNQSLRRGPGGFVHYGLTTRSGSFSPVSGPVPISYLVRPRLVPSSRLPWEADTHLLPVVPAPGPRSDHRDRQGLRAVSGRRQGRSATPPVLWSYGYRVTRRPPWRSRTPGALNGDLYPQLLFPLFPTPSGHTRVVLTPRASQTRDPAKPQWHSPSRIPGTLTYPGGVRPHPSLLSSSLPRVCNPSPLRPFGGSTSSPPVGPGPSRTSGPVATSGRPGRPDSVNPQPDLRIPPPHPVVV